MFDREKKKFTDKDIWFNLDFYKVKQRIERITNQLDGVLSQSSPLREEGDYKNQKKP
jgi:hypothetical protein